MNKIFEIVEKAVALYLKENPGALPQVVEALDKAKLQRTSDRHVAIENFIRRYFAANPTATEWCGTATKLASGIYHDGLGPISFETQATLPQIGRAITDLKRQGVLLITFRMLHGRRVICFQRPTP